MIITWMSFDQCTSQKAFAKPRILLLQAFFGQGLGGFLVGKPPMGGSSPLNV